MAVEVLRHIVNPLQNVHIWQEGMSSCQMWEDMSSKDVMDVACLTDRHVVTICGERYYPKGEKPNKTCQECLKLALELTQDQETEAPSES